jgi:hypothetical protein
VAEAGRERGRKADIGKETCFFGVLGSHTERVELADLYRRVAVAVAVAVGAEGRSERGGGDRTRGCRAEEGEGFSEARDQCAAPILLQPARRLPISLRGERSSPVIKDGAYEDITQLLT